MLHHENGTLVVPFLFSWWSIKITLSVVSEAKPRKKVRITRPKICKLACKAQVEVILPIGQNPYTKAVDTASFLCYNIITFGDLYYRQIFKEKER